jgi:hypothetical protein
MVTITCYPREEDLDENYLVCFSGKRRRSPSRSCRRHVRVVAVILAISKSRAAALVRAGRRRVLFVRGDGRVCAAIGASRGAFGVACDRTGTTWGCSFRRSACGVFGPLHGTSRLPRVASGGSHAAARSRPKAGRTDAEVVCGVSPAISAAGTSADAIYVAAAVSTVSRSLSVPVACPARYGTATGAATITPATTAATWASEEEEEEEECRDSGADGGFGGAASTALGAVTAAFGTDCSGVHGTAIFGGNF